MSMKVNEHVEMLNAFQPFDADFAEIYFENRKDVALQIDTLAGRSVRRLVEDSATRLVVLTGDAGHGKTHLCAQLLVAVGEVAMSEATARLRSHGHADRDVAVLPDGRGLRVIRDLSEFDNASGTVELTTALDRDGVTLVCANEGRLRAVCAGVPRVLNLLDESLVHGRVRSDDRSIAILNLNHQSVVAENRNDMNILQQVLQEWSGKEERWSDCRSCGARDVCPILHNRQILASKEPRGESARSVLQSLMRVVERTGHIVTIRELLILTAHLVTGGLRCQDVHGKVSNGPGQWQWRYLYHQVCFGDLVPPELADSLEVFRGLRLLDPARRSLRLVDDQLDLPRADSTFDPPLHDSLNHVPKNVAEQRVQASAHVDLWRFLRRRDFFESSGSDTTGTITADERLGLRHQATYLKVVSGSPNPHEQQQIRAAVIRGLEALQGLHRGQSFNLRLVDPAFVGPQVSADAADFGVDRTAIVARQVTAASIRLMPESAAWKQRGTDRSVEVLDNVDWLERRLVVSFAGQEAPVDDSLHLMMHEFEFVVATGEGMRAARFFEPETRHILRFLGRLAADGSGDGAIRLVKGGSSYTLMLSDGVLLGGEG